MAPLIDAELERVDRKHAQLTQLSKELVDAINLYHTLMRESDRPIGSTIFPGFMPQQAGMYGMYQTMPNMYMPGGPAGYVPQQMSVIGTMSHSGAHAVSLPSQQQIPQQFQNGHMSHIPQQQMGSAQIPINHNIQAPNNHHSALNNTQLPLSNLPMLSNQIQPMLGNLPQIPVANSLVPQEFMHPNQPIASQPNRIGGATVTQTHHLLSQQQNTVPSQQIPMSQQQPQPNLYPPTQILHNIGGASPVHLASQQHLNNNPMYASSMPNNIMQASETKTNIPIYQQR